MQVKCIWPLGKWWLNGCHSFLLEAADAGESSKVMVRRSPHAAFLVPLLLCHEDSGRMRVFVCQCSMTDRTRLLRCLLVQTVPQCNAAKYLEAASVCYAAGICVWRHGILRELECGAWKTSCREHQFFFSIWRRRLPERSTCGSCRGWWGAQRRRSNSREWSAPWGERCRRSQSTTTSTRRPSRGPPSCCRTWRARTFLPVYCVAPSTQLVRRSMKQGILCRRQQRAHSCQVA